MNKTISTILLILFVQILTFGQDVDLPNKILIIDKYFSPWGTNLIYKYELKLGENKYQIVKTFQNENGKQKKRKEVVGTIDVNEIKELIHLAFSDSTYELQYHDFSELFTKKKAIDFIAENGNNYLITSDIQKEFIFNSLTQPKKVENNLNSYFKDYDHSAWLDGSSTEISISFIYNSKKVSIITKSILEYALPIDINYKSHFNPRLSELLVKIVPASETNRQLQLSGAGLYKSVAKETISINRGKLASLGALSYKSSIDILKSRFKITNLRVVNSLYTTNWEGEKRFNCQLWDTLSSLNVSIMYSSKIEDNRIIYPPSIVINKYDKLIEKLIAIKFFKEFLTENNRRKISIIFDDNSCFTEKTKERVSRDCNIEIDFTNSLFVAVWDENKNLSDWIILPDNKYVLWMEISGEATIPVGDSNFKKCNE